VEQKLYDFSTEKHKWNENMENKREICETKTDFFWQKWKRKRKRNGFFGGTDAERKFPFPSNMEFPF
jgi:hypothetical protein